jgi:hypothetical protein
MPLYRAQVLALAAGATFKPDLRPNDRFGPRGGHVRIRAKSLTAALAFIGETVFIGNEMVENRSQIPDTAAPFLVDNFTPALEAVGGPGDVIDITYTNIGTAACTFNYVVEIENA